MVPNYTRVLYEHLGTLTRLEHLRTFAALKLYHREHGTFPADLTALVGPYLSSAPTAWSDPDRKFEYVPGPNGFELDSDQHGFSYKL
jgi:hypothetical protein